MTYSRQQWDRAVGLYIRYECCAADAIHELGYPSKEALRMWYRERLEEERKSLADDIKDIYAEAKSAGFEVKVVRQIIRIRKQDKAKRQEEEAILDLYLSALGEV